MYRSEQNEGSNDQRTGAESLGSFSNTLWFISNLANVADVDHWSFSASQGNRVSVACFGESEGSGVRGLMVSVLDTAGTAISGGTASETAAAGAVVNNLTLAATGTYYVKLNVTGQASEVISTYVRCGVTVTP
jgi:hypothetical protein